MVQELISYSTIILLNHPFAHRGQTLICFLNCHESFGNAAAQIPLTGGTNCPASPAAIPGYFPFLKLGRGTKNRTFLQDIEIGSRGVGEFPDLHQPGHPSRSTSPGGAQSHGNPSLRVSVCPSGQGQPREAGAEPAREGEEQKLGCWRRAAAEGSCRCDTGVAKGPTLAAQQSTNERGCEQRPKHQPALNCPIHCSTSLMSKITTI